MEVLDRVFIYPTTSLERVQRSVVSVFRGTGQPATRPVVVAFDHRDVGADPDIFFFRSEFHHSLGALPIEQWQIPDGIFDCHKRHGGDSMVRVDRPEGAVFKRYLQ